MTVATFRMTFPLFKTPLLKAAWLKTSALLAGCALLASCSTLIGPRQVDISLVKLQQNLDKRFPIQRRMLSVLDVQLTHPQLSVLPQQDRIAMSVDASVSPPFIHKTWSGSLALSGRLLVDNVRNGVYLSDATVDQIRIDGVDASQQKQLAQVANMVTGELLRETPLYSFRPEDLRYAGVQFVPTRIATTATGIVITLEPAK